MPKVNVQLILTVEGFDPLSESFEQAVESAGNLDGMNYFLEEGIAALKTELLYGRYHQELPSTDGLFPEAKKRTYGLKDVMTGKIENESNKEELWRFVGNTALAVKMWLAKAESVQELQRSADAGNGRLQFILRFDKMDKLHLAVHAIANLRDLHKRIVSVALGGICLDIKTQNGKKRRARSLKDVLEHRSEFDAITKLDAHHIDVLEQIATKLETGATKTTRQFLGYRNSLVHQEPQSVDDTMLYPQIAEEKWNAVVKDGKTVLKTKGLKSRGTTPDWTFDDIFKVVVEAFEHYLGTLRSLRSLETFNPDCAVDLNLAQGLQRV